MSITLGERSSELKELIEKQKNEKLMHELNVEALVKAKTKALEEAQTALQHDLVETRRKSSAAEAAAAATGERERERREIAR